MDIVRFDSVKDLERLDSFLREGYQEAGTPSPWLPQRLHDLIYRTGELEAEAGGERSGDYIFLFAENGRIDGCVLPDGENIYFSFRPEREDLFPTMLEYSEKNCLPLFRRGENGAVKFWVAVSSRQTSAADTLLRLGYEKTDWQEDWNCIFPQNTKAFPEVPEGFRLLYGKEYPDEENKWSALRLCFHPEWESPDYRCGMRSYHERKRSCLYPDSFECLTVDTGAQERNDVCSYCFVYVDRQSNTAMIEPAGTREKYRRRGLGRAMILGAVNRCRDQGVEKCYVDSFGWRKDFYATAGFEVEESIFFWNKTIYPDPV